MSALSFELSGGTSSLSEFIARILAIEFFDPTTTSTEDATAEKAEAESQISVETLSDSQLGWFAGKTPEGKK